jgi:hypothetical protein
LFEKTDQGSDPVVIGYAQPWRCPALSGRLLCLLFGQKVAIPNERPNLCFVINGGLDAERSEPNREMER